MESLALQNFPGNYRVTCNKASHLCLAVQCPAGTFYNTTAARCQLCPHGQWQDDMKKLSCHQCSYGYTKEDGAVSEKECESLEKEKQLYFIPRK